ncbi:MAG: dihydrofolate reductase, partial [Lawsonibacter sp.]|nr:dihydrofolate reductase [Lawsonibacter sp.]
MSVFFYGCITLDGYLANKNHGLDWLHQTGNAGDTGYDAFYQKMDVTI